MEDIVKQWTIYLAAGIEAFAALLIGLAVIEAALSALIRFAQRSTPDITRDMIRLRLGRWLSLALECELAADIIRTAITPTWSDIGLLAAIIVIRTVLNFFLQREIDTPKAGDSQAQG